MSFIFRGARKSMKMRLLFLTLAISPCSFVAGAADIATESKRANEFFDKCWDETVARHPVDESFYGIKTGIPKFRKLGARFTAYTEGWGLYSELTPKGNRDVSGSVF